MSIPQSSPYPPAFEDYTADYSKQQQGLDFFFHSPSDIIAPHPDLFESELDSNLAGFELHLLTVDSNDAFSYLRSDTPTHARTGPASEITFSSESAYDSLSSRSESFYNYPPSPAYSSSNYSFPMELEMDFQRIHVDSVSDYVAQTNVNGLDSTAVDDNSFGELPPTPPRSPAAPRVISKVYEARSSFSDYGPSRRDSVSSDYYSQLNYANAGSTVSPEHISTQLPVVPSISHLQEEYKGDPRKKYKCSACPRAFARAYNLKTHMATHDPNRLKPHVCPHRSCGRSFSRKHDLGRHLISIHRDESVCSSHHSASSKKSIGVDKGLRSWCDSCGKGSVGRDADCDCLDIK